MSKQLHNYIRSHRKRAGLTQKELAFLLGCNHASMVSRYERFRVAPELPAALACQVVFRVPTAELFSGIYTTVEQQVIRRATLLSQSLSDTEPPSAHLECKQAFLLKVIVGEDYVARPIPWER